MPTGKKDEHKAAVKGLLDGFLQAGDDRKIRTYLAANSNLPGPRGNLELAQAFADVVEELSWAEPKKMWDLASGLAALSPDEAPVNDPNELIPFCGVLAVGAIGSISEEHERQAFAVLKEMAGDPRWRTREGVAMGLQNIISERGMEALRKLEGWADGDDWLIVRAAAAGVAEPPLLKDPKIAGAALGLHKKIIAQMLASDNRRSEEFRTLRQALGYSLSVVVCACPGEGFVYMRELAESSDPDIRWVVRENLKKNRLVKSFPREIEALKASK